MALQKNMKGGNCVSASSATISCNTNSDMNPSHSGPSMKHESELSPEELQMIKERRIRIIEENDR